MNTKPFDIAYQVAVAADRPPRRRRKWAGQRAWDREHMVTESTQFTRERDAALRRCCAAAGINRSQLIAYLLETWMAAWSAAERNLDGN